MQNQVDQAIFAEEQEDLSEMITSGTDLFSAYMMTEGLSSELLSAPGIAQGGSVWNPTDWRLPTETFSGSSIPTVTDMMGKTKLGSLLRQDIGAGAEQFALPEVQSLIMPSTQDLMSGVGANLGHSIYGGSNPVSTLIHIGSKD